LRFTAKTRIPFGLRDLDHAADLSNAHIVVEHVDAAIDRSAGRDHCRDIIGLGHVGTVGDRLPAFTLDDRSRLLRGGFIEVRAKHSRTFARECDRCSLAVAPTLPDRSRSDDQCYLFLKPIGHVIPSLPIAWRQVCVAQS